MITNSINTLFESFNTRKVKGNEIDKFNYFNYLLLTWPPAVASCILGKGQNLEANYFRSRIHESPDDSYFFNNVSDLTHAPQHLITKFGRCNSPHQSMFYCSNNSKIAYTEVGLLSLKKSILPNYFTTGIWHQRETVYVNPIAESGLLLYRNQLLTQMTETVFSAVKGQIASSQFRDDQIKYLQFLGKEFTSPLSINEDVYLLSAAFSATILNQSINGRNLDGIIYPTCLESGFLRQRGLNLAFVPDIVGFNKKIECIGAYRGKIEFINGEFSETELIYSKGVDKETGEIYW